MGWIIVIEENPKSLADIQEAVLALDPKILVISFTQSSEFLNWMQDIQDHKTNLSPQVPSDKFLGLVTSIETWRFRDVKLIGKFKALFIQKGFAKSEDDIFVAITGYETPNFQKRRFEYRSINNFLFKPFEKLTLREFLRLCFAGRSALKVQDIYVAKASAQIEMLKEIHLSAVDELGFQTLSDRPLTLGSIAKYYSAFLETRQHRSALAEVVSSTPRASEGVHDVRLRFFALDNAQSFAVQKLAQSGKRRLLSNEPNGKDRYEFYFVRSHASGLSQEVEPSLERFFDHPMQAYETASEANTALAHLQKSDFIKARIVFLDCNQFLGNEVVEVQRFLALHPDKQIKLFLLSSEILPEKAEIELSAICQDIYYVPFNRSYIAKALKQKFPDLVIKEELYEWFKETDESLYAATPADLVEVSEIGVVIRYHRPIALGKFREFVFSLPNETEAPNVLAQCNFTQASEDKKSWLCHFVFFGLHDHELKFIRRWMLTQYVDQKQKS